jgi:hypothetical protein
MTNWMNRKEAAEYLKMSTRQLDRLRLPRSVVGASPRYSQEVIDEWLKQRTVEPRPPQKPPGPKPKQPRWRPLRNPDYAYLPDGSIDVSATLKKTRKRLGY